MRHLWFTSLRFGDPGRSARAGRESGPSGTPIPIPGSATCEAASLSCLQIRILAFPPPFLPGCLCSPPGCRRLSLGGTPTNWPVGLTGFSCAPTRGAAALHPPHTTLSPSARTILDTNKASMVGDFWRGEHTNNHFRSTGETCSWSPLGGGQPPPPPNQALCKHCVCSKPRTQETCTRAQKPCHHRSAASRKDLTVKSRYSLRSGSLQRKLDQTPRLGQKWIFWLLRDHFSGNSSSFSIRQGYN